MADSLVDGHKRPRLDGSASCPSYYSLGMRWKEAGLAARLPVQTYCNRLDKKVSLTGQRLYRSVGIAILPDMVAGYTGAYPFPTPAIFRFVDSPKSSLILEHQANILAAVDNFQLSDCIINFFEASISSSLAFLGCLLRGITLRHPWRCSTK